jgi:hypothetical protein
MLGELGKFVIEYFLSASGFLVALFVHRNSEWSMRRMLYGILNSTLFMLSAALSLLWIFSYQAMAKDALWLLTLSVFLGVAVFGYVRGASACARSVSAVGSGENAWMGLVPIVQWALFFWKPLKDVEPSRMRTAINIGGIVLIIFMMLVGADLRVTRLEKMHDEVDRVRLDPSLRYLNVKLLIASQGLDPSLRHIAFKVAPTYFSDKLELARAEAHGSHLRYIYYFTGQPELVFLKTYHDSLNKIMCRSLRGLIGSEAVVEYQLLRPDETQIELVVVPLSACVY